MKAASRIWNWKTHDLNEKFGRSKKEQEAMSDDGDIPENGGNDEVNESVVHIAARGSGREERSNLAARVALEARVARLEDAFRSIDRLSDAIISLDRKFERMLVHFEVNKAKTEDLEVDAKDISKHAQIIAQHHAWLCGDGHDAGLKMRVVELEKDRAVKSGQVVILGTICAALGGLATYLSGHISGWKW